MDSVVEKPVDNSEDNGVENKQEIDLQLPSWIETWSQYLLMQSPASSAWHPEAVDLIQQILLATTRGESCMRATQSQVLALQHLGVAEYSAFKQVAPFIYDDEFIYLYRYWQLEQRLAQQVIRIQQQAVDCIDTQAFQNLLSDPQQKRALEMVATQGLSMITGGPGTGKTYTLARIIAVLHDANAELRIAMAAPTGKAAQRMKEALQHSFNDEKLTELGLMDARLKQQETFTIHRLLGLGHHTIPRFNAKQPLPYDVIVIDEASMLDLQLGTLLLEAIPAQCRLILLGDAQQLSSVDVGSVLADLQQLDVLKNNRVNLVTSRRFKAGALIGQMANFIQVQPDQSVDADQLLMAFEQAVVPAGTLVPVPLSADMEDVIQLEYLAAQPSETDITAYYQKLSWGFRDYFLQLNTYIDSEVAATELAALVTAFDQYRILTPIHFGALGLTALNRAMEAAFLQQHPYILKQGDWYVGRPIMITSNDYQLGLSNGDIGLCLPHRQIAQQYEVYFPSLDLWLAATRLPKSIQTAFAMTIHKSQGSEFKHVAIIFDSSSKKLLSQELIYTAITRAKSVVSLLVDQKTFAKSLFVKTCRNSGLGKKIKACVN